MSEIVPEIAIIDVESKTHAPPLKMKRSESCHIDIETYRKGIEAVKAESIAYFNKHSITKVMDALVSRLLRDRPPHPVAECAVALRTADDLAALSDSDASVDPRDLLRTKFDACSDPDYLNKFNLPTMFEDLLSQLVEEKPDDPYSFCLTWLRWHRHIFEDDGPMS
eukprot:TRINITY_DN5290_c0_g1_i1.p1 TRINITY_DN5290_c0_g1~~TRINITY_DN5290_c0_g1_i1.p1  ORF type:complete len:166 (-),score=37.04 TRINITY_DN5290_c0_g1_i1:18-515(-)